MSGITNTNSNYQRRKLVNRVMTVLAYACTLAAIVPLTLVLAYLIFRGLPAWDLEFFTGLPIRYGPGGGVLNAIIGTGILVVLSCAMGIPVGIMSGIYLAEYGNNRLGDLIRFVVDVLSGVPSIVVGLFAYVTIVVVTGFSAFAAGFALAILMVPVIARTTEGVLRLVPDNVREASLALGVPRWRTILSVVLPTATGGIITGIFLSVARIAGETAPLIFTILGSSLLNFNPFSGAMAALPLQIFQFAKTPFPAVVEKAWGTALLLVFVVLGLNLIAKLIFGRQKVKS